ncbi:MAG: hypothetical protein IJU55_06000, partial [Selenomonadaceae bacterium]|nr:hypothetical protein [Selenomonadaceae bacterium]
MNRKFFNLQLFADISNYDNDTLVSGTEDDDSIYSRGANVTITSGAGNDTIFNDYDGNGSHENAVIYAGVGNDSIRNEYLKATIDAGTGDDYIEAYGVDVTIDAGAGNDTVMGGSDVNTGGGNDYITAGGQCATIASGAGNDTLNLDSEGDYTVTDFDVNDVLYSISSYNKPEFARFANGVLNVSNIFKVSLPNVKNINNYRNMAIKWNDRDDETGEEILVEKTLGELLDVPSPYWKVSGTTATYYDADGSVILTLTGLKSGLKADNGEIAGIDVNCYDKGITLSKDLLDKKTVSLNRQKGNEQYHFSNNLFYKNPTVPEAGFERDGHGIETVWSISGTTATLKTKCTTAGYYQSGDKIKYCAKDAVNTVATINGIKSGTKVNEDGSITGISVYYENDGDVSYGSVDFSDSAPISDKVTVDSDEISFNFSSEDENGKPNLFNNHTVTGGANDDHIDFYGANNVVNTGAGNDYVSVREWWNEEHSALITKNNTINTGVGSDSIDVGGANNKINSGDGSDYVLMHSDSEKVTVDTGNGDDLVVFGSGQPEYSQLYQGNNHLVNTGAGNDTISAHSDWNWEVDESYRIPILNNTINAGTGDDLISTTDAEMTSAVINAGAGNDTIEMAKATSSMIDAGDGNDYISVLGDYNYSWDDEEGIEKLSYGLNANDNTISAGAGNDTIHIGGENNVIQYASGDGNDTIFGYTSKNTLQIAGSYSTQKSGSDLIVKVGSGNITLKDVSKANIETVAGHIVWTASGTTATGKIDGKVVATITGLKKGFKADSISDSGSVISISQDALGTAAVKLTKGDYTLALANDVEESVKTLAHWNVDGSGATYRSLDITKGYTVATNGKSITYVSK